MTSWVVADSGLFLAIVLREPNADLAKRLLARWTVTGIRLAAPNLLRYEFVSVVRKHIARGQLSQDEGQRAVDGLLDWPMDLFASDALLLRGLALAAQLNLPVAYDSFYLALAEHLGCEFWTVDEKLVNAVGERLPWSGGLAA